MLQRSIPRIAVFLGISLFSVRPALSEQVKLWAPAPFRLDSNQTAAYIYDFNPNFVGRNCTWTLTPDISIDQLEHHVELTGMSILRKASGALQLHYTLHNIGENLAEGSVIVSSICP